MKTIKIQKNTNKIKRYKDREKEGNKETN